MPMGTRFFGENATGMGQMANAQATALMGGRSPTTPTGMRLPLEAAEAMGRMASAQDMTAMVMSIPTMKKEIGHLSVAVNPTTTPANVPGGVIEQATNDIQQYPLQNPRVF